MRALLAYTTILAAALAVTACDPYDPNLGDHPFRCGANGECPEKYVCVDYSETVRLCEPKNSPNVPDGGVHTDGTPYHCGSDDSIEPNDSITDPTITPIPDFGDDYELVGLQICPDTDLDIFRFRTDVVGKTVVVTITYPSNQGLLALDILNSGGDVIKSGTPTGNPDAIEARIDNLPASTYFAQVSSGAAGVENDYSIDIVTSGP